MTVVPLHPAPPTKTQGVPRAGLVAGLDIGSTKISCMIGSVNRKGRGGEPELHIKGFGTTASRGIHAGAVANLADAERAIRVAVDTAERMAGVAVSDIYVGISGGRPKSMRFSGSARLHASTVQQGDIDRVVAQALMSAQVGTRTILHLSPLRFVLDGVPTDVAPIGMHGQQLSIDVSLLTIETPFLQNLSEAIDKAHLSVAGYVPAAHASGLGCLAEDEQTLGTVLIEMGSAVTSIGVFKHGKLVHADVVPLGGQHITHDIARVLCTSVPHAERLKTLYGGLLAFGKDEHDLISVSRIGEQGIDSLHQIARSHLTEIVRPRMEEILELVGEKIQNAGAPATTCRRAVLSGGAAALPGLRELSRSVLGLETRIAHVAQGLRLPDMLRQPSSIVSIGLLAYALDPAAQLVMPVQAQAAIERQQLGYMRRVGRWLADSF